MLRIDGIFIHCEVCGVVPVPKKHLPVVLPEDVDFQTPGNPLVRHPTWKHVDCPQCGAPARRETDTLDTFVEYYFGQRPVILKNASDLSSWSFDSWRGSLRRRGEEAAQPGDLFIRGGSNTLSQRGPRGSGWAAPSMR